MPASFARYDPVWVILTILILWAKIAFELPQEFPTVTVDITQSPTEDICKNKRPQHMNYEKL